jgi:hypothetical protein
MESISTRTFFDFNHLQEEVRRIKPLRPQWPRFLEVQQEFSVTGKSSEGVAAIPCQTVENSIKAIGAGTGVLIPIDEGPGISPLATVRLWHSLWKLQGRDIPRVIFMGGNGIKIFVAFFLQPLTMEDFGRLWSA